MKMIIILKLVGLYLLLVLWCFVCLIVGMLILDTIGVLEGKESIFFKG